MRVGPTDEAVAGSLSWQPQVAAWLGGRVVALDVPVMSGSVTCDVSQQVPERLTLTVPRVSTVDGRRFDWLPTAADSPLARYGQTLSVQIVTGSTVTGTTWTTRIGMYRIQSWSEDSDGAIQVEAAGMLQVVAGDKLPSPVAPSAEATFAGEFRRLLPTGFSVTVDPGLPVRYCPLSMSWEDDRLKALYEIADAWPARLRTTEDGWRLALLPPLADDVSSTPAVTLHDGVRGTAVQAPLFDTRDQTYNRVIARSSATDSPASTPLQVVVDQPLGPMATTGAYGVEAMVWSSPLATTLGQLEESGRSILADKVRGSRVLKVTCAPDPRTDVDDLASVTYQGRTERGYVVGYDLPLTVGPAMQVRVGVAA